MKKHKTAEKIDSWQRYQKCNAKWCHEVLYRTIDGNWILWGEGGPESKYSKLHGGGKDIIQLSNEEALWWLTNKAGNVAAIKKFFAKEIKDA